MIKIIFIILLIIINFAIFDLLNEQFEPANINDKFEPANIKDKFESQPMPNNQQTNVFCNDKVFRDVGELMFKKKDEYQDIYEFNSVGKSNYINNLPLPLSSEHEVDVYMHNISNTNNADNLNNITMQTNSI